jgi:ZIP family zinc transporter
MPQWLLIIVLTLGAGAAIPVGAFLARIESLVPQWLDNELRHFVIAFGGGALLAAVALILVPDGIKYLPVWAATLSFAGGGLAFMSLDVYLAKRGTSASQLVAMLADFLPEAIALGAICATGGSNNAYLLAGLIALQNVPEGFNAYRESVGSIPSQRLLIAFCLLALLGPVAGMTGFFLLASSPVALAVLMLFAAGGILYLIFQDIAPQARLKQHWSPPMGAVAGFLLGTIGHMLLMPG